MKTFVVKVWDENSSDDGGPHGLKGTVQNIATGRQTAFLSADDLIAMLKAAIETGETTDR